MLHLFNYKSKCKIAMPRNVGEIKKMKAMYEVAKLKCGLYVSGLNVKVLLKFVKSFVCSELCVILHHQTITIRNYENNYRNNFSISCNVN
jgi:hypothetical protein